MLEQIPLSQLALLLSDIEIILNHFAMHDETAVERIAEIDLLLHDLDQTDQALTHLMQTDLGHMLENKSPTAAQETDSQPPIFAVASEGIPFWQTLHEDLLTYFTWQIDKKEAEMRIPLLDAQIAGQQRFLEEINRYAAV